MTAKFRRLADEWPICTLARKVAAAIWTADCGRNGDYPVAMAWTVQRLVDERMTLHASCNACHHNRRLDLMVLRERLGPDAPAMATDLIPRLRCDGCGGRDVSLTYSPNTTPSGDIGASYRQAKEGR